MRASMWTGALCVVSMALGAAPPGAAVGLGHAGSDSVFRRSLSALDLSLLAALDNEAHRRLWAAAPRIDPARHVEVQSMKSVLRAAHAALARDEAPSPSAQTAEDRVLETLARMR
jgi:hypothetical protein